MVGGMLVGTFFAFILGLVNPAVKNKAGPDWMWAGGRDDLVRSLYFRPNGALRRYGLQGLVLTLGLGTAALLWLIERL